MQSHPTRRIGFSSSKVAILLRPSKTRPYGGRRPPGSCRIETVMTATTNAMTWTTTNGMTSIQRIARFAGALYLLIAALAAFVHFYVPGELIVAGDATTTANNIMASNGLFRWGIAGQLIILSCEIVLSILLYVLLRPVSKTLSLIAAVSRLAMTAIHGAILLVSFFVLVLLSGAGYLAVFNSEQAAALAMLFLDVSSYGSLSVSSSSPFTLPCSAT